MDTSYKTTCPHCGHEVTLSDTALLHYSQRILGSLSATKRPHLKEHLRAISRKHWDTVGRHPLQTKLLHLAASEDLRTLTLREIADKLNLTGKNALSYHVNHLRKRGLLPKKHWIKSHLKKEIELLLADNKVIDEIHLSEAIEQDLIVEMFTEAGSNQEGSFGLKAFEGYPIVKGGIGIDIRYH